MAVVFKSIESSNYTGRSQLKKIDTALWRLSSLAHETAHSKSDGKIFLAGDFAVFIRLNFSNINSL